MLPIKFTGMKSVFHDSRFGGHILKLKNGDVVFVPDSDATKYGSPMKAAHAGRWSEIDPAIPVDSYFLKNALA